MRPILQHPHKLEPEPKTEELLSNLIALLNGVSQGSAVILPSGLPAIAKEWLTRLKDGLVSAPPELIRALNSLPNEIREDADVRSEINTLLTLSVLRVNRNQETPRSIDRGAAVYATVVVKQLRQAYSSECIAIATEIWKSSIDAAHKASLSQDERPVKHLLHISSRIGGILGRLDVPQAYYHFESLLTHDWPEIRNEGAFWLRYWKSSSLADTLIEALMMGKNDPKAPNFSKYIIQALASLQDARILAFLQELTGTAFDSATLQQAIISCAGQTSILTRGTSPP